MGGYVNLPLRPGAKNFHFPIDNALFLCYTKDNQGVVAEHQGGNL